MLPPVTLARSAKHVVHHDPHRTLHIPRPLLVHEGQAPPTLGRNLRHRTPAQKAGDWFGNEPSATYRESDMNYVKELRYLAELESKYTGRLRGEVSGVRWSTDGGKTWNPPRYRAKPFICAYCLGDLGQSIPDACPHCGHTMLEPSSAEAASRSPE